MKKGPAKKIKKRPSKGVFWRSKHKNSLSTSEVGVFNGEHGQSGGTLFCSTVVVQAKKGSKGKPVSVAWHMFPSHLKKFMGPSAKQMFVEELKAGRVSKKTTERTSPKDIVDAMVERVNDLKEDGAHVTATVLPGSVAMNKAREEARGSVTAINKVLKELNTHKKSGNVHNVKTRGAYGKGTTWVFIDGKTGKINRGDLKTQYD